MAAGVMVGGFSQVTRCVTGKIRAMKPTTGSSAVELLDGGDIDGDWLRAARAEVNWTQSALGEFLGLGQKTIAGWERTGRVPRARYPALRTWLAAAAEKHTRLTYADLANLTWDDFKRGGAVDPDAATAIRTRGELLGEMKALRRQVEGMLAHLNDIIEELEQ